MPEHEEIGGNILKQNNYKYWKKVFYHGKIDIEYNLLYLDILNKADMQINKYGNEVGYKNRLENIKNRNGDNSITYIKTKKLIDSLKKNSNFLFQ